MNNPFLRLAPVLLITAVGLVVHFGLRSPLDPSRPRPGAETGASAHHSQRAFSARNTTGSIPDSANVDRQLAGRVRDLVARQAELNRSRETSYWQRDTPETRAAEERRRLEERRLLDELATLAGHPAGTAATLAFLSEERLAEVTPAVAALDAERHELELSNAGGTWDGEDGSDSFQRWQDLGRKIESKLAETLTPEELRGWVARGSAEATTLRSRAIDLSPDQFEAVAMAEWSFRRGADGGEAKAAEIEALRGTRDAAIQAALPADLQARYERTSDPTFQGEAGFASRNALPAEYADRLYDLRSRLDSAERTLVERSVAPEDRNATLAAMARAARDDLRRTLGEPLYASYLESPLSLWLQRFGGGDDAAPANNQP